MIYLNWLDHLDKSSKNALKSEFLSVDYTINKVVFSPLGSYLAVCSPDGTHIYYGSTLIYKGFLPQINAVDAKFSFD
jgi:WD40 repeat protein